MQRQDILREEDDEAAADRQTASLAGVAITLVLLIVGLFLVRELHAKAAIEDCLMAGRSNCDWLVQAQF
jgi:hypothetical protein